MKDMDFFLEILTWVLWHNIKHNCKKKITSKNVKWIFKNSDHITDYQVNL